MAIYIEFSHGKWWIFPVQPPLPPPAPSAEMLRKKKEETLEAIQKASEQDRCDVQNVRCRWVYAMEHSQNGNWIGKIWENMGTYDEPMALYPSFRQAHRFLNGRNGHVDLVNGFGNILCGLSPFLQLRSLGNYLRPFDRCICIPLNKVSKPAARSGYI